MGERREGNKKRERERNEGRECIRVRNKVAYLHGEIACTADCKLHRKSWGVIWPERKEEDLAKSARYPDENEIPDRYEEEKEEVEKADGKRRNDGQVYGAREMIYETIVENESRESKDGQIARLWSLPLPRVDNGLITRGRV